MAATRVRLAPATAIRALCSYAKLGLQRGASDDAVRQAFREAAQRHHPDKAGGDRARFEECKAAHDAILEGRADTGHEPSRWERRHWERAEQHDDFHHDERDFDRPEPPEQRERDTKRVWDVFKVLLGVIAIRFMVVGIAKYMPTERPEEFSRRSIDSNRSSAMKALLHRIQD